MKDKRPKDPMQLAKLIGDIATGQVEDTISPLKKSEASLASKPKKRFVKIKRTKK